ncbi:MAG: DUF6491 family protein [Pseudomonadota bacterium]
MTATFRTVLLALLLGMASASSAHATTSAADTSIWVGTHGRVSSWRPVAPNKLVLWASPSRPYLVTVWRPVQSLRFAQRIHVSRSGGRITRFDRVTIDGERLPIVSIQRIDREVARELRFSREPLAF